MIPSLYCGYTLATLTPKSARVCLGIFTQADCGQTLAYSCHFSLQIDSRPYPIYTVVIPLPAERFSWPGYKLGILPNLYSCLLLPRRRLSLYSVYTLAYSCQNSEEKGELKRLSLYSVYTLAYSCQHSIRDSVSLSGLGISKGQSIATVKPRYARVLYSIYTLVFPMNFSSQCEDGIPLHSSFNIAQVQTYSLTLMSSVLSE